MSADRGWVRRGTTVLRADPRRVIAKLFLPGQELVANGRTRADALVARALALSEDEVKTTLADVVLRHRDRHRDVEQIFTAHFAAIAHLVPDPDALSAERRDLIGAYITQEYAVEAAALFNPSMVAHPDQTGLAAGEVRFVMSVRAVGEGHISSIEFRTGVATADTVRVDDPGTTLVVGTVTSTGPAEGDYELQFPADRPLSERVIYPSTENEQRGIEDARFTLLTTGDGATSYYGTYTAFDGVRVSPRMVRTTDFTRFSMSQLSGPAAKDKGMALFPRLVGGRYQALSRWDRESIAISSSADGHSWDPAVTVDQPHRPWELIQLGNCGSPIETADGWLVLMHGVGPVRTYGIGALLLDLADPTRLIGNLSEPLLLPDDDERNGYVPNVVYSCGAMRVGESLVIPYGCSDSSIRFAFVELAELLTRLRTG